MHNNGENIGLIRSLLNGNCQEFVERFESFLDQCPSFCTRWVRIAFSCILFGMFATAFDSDVADNEKFIFILTTIRMNLEKET